MHNILFEVRLTIDFFDQCISVPKAQVGGIHVHNMRRYAKRVRLLDIVHMHTMKSVGKL